MAGRDERVLVTGGGGFIGHALVVDQLRRGRRVRSLDRAHPVPLPSDLAPAGERLAGSILDSGALARACAGCARVFHLASAHLEVRARERHYRRTNVDGTRTVVEAAAAAGAARVVHVSTVGVYGRHAGEIVAEDSPTAPTIAYERTKLEGERAARETAAARGIELVIARPSWVYGPGCRRTGKIFAAIGKRRFPMIGRGRPRRDGLYIDDATRGLDSLGTHPAAAGETFLLVSGEAPTVREWVDAIAAAQGVPPPRLGWPVAAMWLAGFGMELAGWLTCREPPFSRRSLKFYTNATVFDPGKIRRIVGFEPAVGWREGIRRTAEALRAAGGGRSDPDPCAGGDARGADLS
ncbi:MAG: NAD-dependent epimerase/dehydratase family protein [Planctomycetes bacterium]|nr:NAD-dependent epimerase/dehydratase family protein [Planctomycetota bacterium]